MPAPFPLCYQHNDFVIINKPCGISVHKDDNDIGLTTALAQQLGVEQVWLVHRLDKMTSGLLMLALNRESAKTLSQMFADHQIQKTYWALSNHKPKKKQGKIVGDMARSRNGAWKLCKSLENPAITQFHSVSIEPKLRHFILQPKTGKTHQLRVAMKSLGSPILGDHLYRGDPADRLYLHAHRLDFYYQGENISVTCEPTSGELWGKICRP
ncbi:RNA pseudouridine synthase [Haemophilus paracuniculus]|uniref:RNA pseudouridine synthase n=1 Tax=Haemophilus paracuniculus TaxID=734 RepID=A0A1T0AT83_9PAST|nr:TIGR01621 family pseudouridine synthase [Haemophilus paracuniculus]OOR99613.1 RNA pseudouridine synthase [Haemophilus paracuniculus]